MGTLGYSCLSLAVVMADALLLQDKFVPDLLDVGELGVVSE